MNSLVTSVLIGLAFDLLVVKAAINIAAAGAKTYVVISILRRHQWWCPVHQRRHQLGFWPEGYDPFASLYIFDHILRYHLCDDNGPNDWDYDPFTWEIMRECLPMIWLPYVKLARGRLSQIAAIQGKTWNRIAFRIRRPFAA